ncbi:FecCD family ABC transporter permease [Methanospirillum lacunae]|uniref:Cobalamin import system permease protein BtuC n=1 Tax=Methanospirillum lacunae TaxID=668570 RepID=A0A2V2N1L2_9EURY|nr:iron ABC transporter permease [Methanospirillum lacunae]PWR72540.1 ABC transporter permease [Methanospirillum lacunae]
MRCQEEPQLYQRKITRFSDGFSIFLLVILIFLIAISVFCGKYQASPFDALYQVIQGNSVSGDLTGIETVFWEIRVPRIIAAVLVGTGLAISGAVLQGIFNNPIVSPQFLGITSGAAFGAAVALLLSFSFATAGIFAFLGGVLAVVFVILINRLFSFQTITGLVLAGIIVESIFQSGIGLIKYLADPGGRLPSLMYWMMGSFNHVTSDGLLIAGPVLMILIMFLYSIRWQINLLCFGEETANNLGVPASLLYVIILLAVSLITAASISLAGPIGWIGLVIPNIIRSLSGLDHLLSIPRSALLGGSYLLIMDTIARTAAPTEIPVGILTALIGVPFFLFILKSQHRVHNYGN